MKTRKQKAADYIISNSSSEFSPTNQSLNSTPFVSYKSSQIRLNNQERIVKRRGVSKESEVESTALFLTGFNAENDESPSPHRKQRSYNPSSGRIQFVQGGVKRKEKKPQNLIPLTQESRRHDRDSSDESRPKVSPSPNKSVSWGQIARGVIGPLTPKYSMVHHHIKSAKASDTFSASVKAQENNEAQEQQASAVPSMPSLMSSRMVKRQQEKRVQFDTVKIPALRAEEEKQKRLKKYDDMIESLNKLKETANQSANILSSIRARYEKKSEKKVEERNKFIPRVIMGHEGPICPLDRAILMKAELISWRKQRAAKKLEELQKSKLNPVGMRMKHASVSIKRLHSPNLEPLSLKSRNKAHHRTAASLPSKLNEKPFLRVKHKGRHTVTSLSSDVSKHRKGKRNDRPKLRTHKVVRSSKIKSETLSHSQTRTKRFIHSQASSAQFHNTPAGTQSPNAVPPTKENLKQFTGLQSKSRRLLGIYQHSVIQMMKKREPKPMRARFTSLKSLEGRDFTYNLSHLRHHLDFSDASAHAKLNSSHSFHQPRHPLKVKSKSLKYAQYSRRKQPSKVLLQLPRTLHSEQSDN